MERTRQAKFRRPYPAVIQVSWPGGLYYGFAVLNLRNNRHAHVVSAGFNVIPDGQVPILYDNTDSEFEIVPYQELIRLSRLH